MRTLAGAIAAGAVMSGCGAATKTSFDALPPRVRAAPAITLTTTVTARPAAPAPAVHGPAAPAPAAPTRPPSPGGDARRPPDAGAKQNAKRLRHDLRKLLRKGHPAGD